jgi:aldehyde:ferredoxin oxidoreductase
LPEFCGYAGKILRVNLTDRKVCVTQTDKDLIREFVGGRGFNSRRLFEEVPNAVAPLSAENKLMFATGPLVGTAFPLGARFNVSSKSPLTGILGDSNAGGHFAAEMKFAGYDQIIFEGKSRKLCYVFVSNDEVRFKSAENLTGKDVYETTETLKKDLGDERICIAAVGPAAENLVRYAGIFADLMRPAARTGMGTVMASKNLKAVAIRGTGAVDISDEDGFWKIVDEVEAETYSHPQYWPRRKMGTTRILMLADEMGFLPTRHFTSATFEGAARVSGERLAEEYNIKSRACFSCIVPCSRTYVIKEGIFAGFHGEGPEYEALSSLTARIGNSDLDSALVAVDLANKLGLDVITTSECIAWAMELYAKHALTKKETGGLELEWGNIKAVLELIWKIAYREGFGDTLADGVKKAAEKLKMGSDISFHVKGLELIQADPRGLKGYGLGYAVSSRGGDHLRSEPFLELNNDPEKGMKMFGEPHATIRLGVKGKGKLVRYFEDWCAVIDSLEVCKNLAGNMELLPLKRAAKLMKVVTGFDFTERQLTDVGERIVNLERVYLVREGITRKDDRLPERFTKEPLPDGASKGSVFEMEPMLEEYYRERKWSTDGVPLPQHLRKLGLNYAIAPAERNSYQQREK